MDTARTPRGQEEKWKLPASWRWVKLGEVCAIKGGKRLPCGTNFVNDQTPYPYIRVVDFIDGTVDMRNLRYLDKIAQSAISRYTIGKDDVYISIAGSIGIVGTIPESLDGANLTENAAKLVIFDKEDVSRDYLARFLMSSIGQEFIIKRTNTVGQPKLALSRIATIPIPLPPLAEQQRISGVLHDQIAAAEKARAAAQARLEAVKTLPAAFLRQAFPQHGQPLPDGWRWVKLEEVCTDISDGTHFTPTYVPNGVPFLSVKDVKEGGLSFLDCRFITQEQHQEFCRRCKPEKGDVLYTKVGTTGIAKSIDIEIDFSIFVSVALLKLRSIIIPDYLEKVLNSPVCRAQAENLTQGMANRNLVLKDLKLIILPLPPLADQEHIACVLLDQMAAVQKARTAAEEELAAINALPAALLPRAFNGEL